SSNTDCATNKCFTIMPGSSQYYCSALCETDTDCANGTTCQTAALSLINEWMYVQSGLSQTTLQGSTTLIRLCAFPN
ncbi:MAG: hypothetical protein VX278_18550, partial [Myxococcota bacterium]|nr:hypothetical protein [Myxococcota bacterium]